MILNESDAERFWSKVQKFGPVPKGKPSLGRCWMWIPQMEQNRYGCFTLNNKSVTAHRVSWELHRGPIPNSLMVLHHCDNRPCCNPDHLFLGTQLDNITDCVSKKRNAFGARHGSKTKPERVARGERHGFTLHPESIPKGERNGNSRLTNKRVIAIRREYAKGGITQARLANRLGIPLAHLNRIIVKKAWRHI